jgi:hypothetical protein
MNLEEQLESLHLDETIEIHEAAEGSIIQPNGAVQVIRECWCKLYHAFGNQVSVEHVQEHLIRDNIYCLVLRSSCPFYTQLPFHQVLFQKLKIQTHGPAIFYKKGSPLSVEETQTLFQ